MHPEDPARLGNYHVVRRLRDVPIGTTLLGTDQTGRAVVLTVADAGLAAQDGFRERFAHEARAAALAPPAFVAAVLDVDVDADRPWLATVAVAGQSLEEFVRERGPLGDAGTTALAQRLSEGLRALHAAGLVHGDLTPTAVVLAEDGPRLVGYGLARAAGPGYGTPGFQAPEQTEAAGPLEAAASSSPAVDVFALGCVLGYAATGRSPFAAGDAAAPRGRVAQAEPDLATLAEPLRSLVLACLDKDPGRRPTAAQVVARAAAPSMGEPGPGAAPTVVTAPASGWGAPSATLVGAPPIGPGGPAPFDDRGRPPGAWPNGPVGPQAPAAWAAAPQRYGPPALSEPAAARSRGPLIAVVALAVVVVLTLVGGGVWLLTRGSTTTASGPTSTAGPVAPAPGSAGSTAGPTSSSSVTKANPDPGTGATLVDVSAFGADSPRFTTPSRNIACQMTNASATDPAEVRCDVAQRSWTVPTKPADCPGVYGTGAQVRGTDQGQLTCVSDTLADPGLQVLQYGQALSFGGILCDSQETGVRCVNRTTGHGFRVARASYDLF